MSWVLEAGLAVSLHFGLGDGWNERHPFIRATDQEWTIGAYLNSEDALSAYVSRTWERDSWFAELGLVTGYSGIEIAPLVRLGRELNENTRLFIVPGYDAIHKRGGVVLGLEMKLGK